MGGPVSVDFRPRISNGKAHLPLHYPCFMFLFSHLINDNALRCHPSGLRDIITSLQDPTTAKYSRATGTRHHKHQQPADKPTEQFDRSLHHHL